MSVLITQLAKTVVVLLLSHNAVLYNRFMEINSCEKPHHKMLYPIVMCNICVVYL